LQPDDAKGKEAALQNHQAVPLGFIHALSFSSAAVGYKINVYSNTAVASKCLF